MPLTADEIAARSDDNYVAMWSMYASMRDGGEVRERDGLVIACPMASAAMFNNAFIMRPLRDPDAQIADAVAFFDQVEVPFCVRIREGVDPRAERACERRGLPYSDTVPGMALGDLTVIPPPMEGLRIVAARDDATRDQHRNIVRRVFEMPEELVDWLLTDRLMTVRDSEYYVGYVDGEPVATAALIVTHRVAGIVNVATDPAHRGRGIGEAMTGHAIRRGVEMGCVMSSLQASEMGRPVYERMGFRVVSPYRTFHRPGV